MLNLQLLHRFESLYPDLSNANIEYLSCALGWKWCIFVFLFLSKDSICKELAKGYHPRSAKEDVWTPWEDHKNTSATSKTWTEKY